jgi:hypothetical protein
MQEAFQALQADVAPLFAATIIVVVFFLIARIVRVRQPLALAFAMMPLLATWALVGTI